MESHVNIHCVSLKLIHSDGVEIIFYKNILQNKLNRMENQLCNIGGGLEVGGLSVLCLVIITEMH